MGYGSASNDTRWGAYLGAAPYPWAAPLGQAGELGEVGLALLDVGVLALLALFGHVIEHGGVAGKLLDAGEAVGVGVEGGLEEADGDGALLQDLARPLHRLVLQALKRDDGVDEAH